MARDNENGAVVTPLLGAGVLGTGAYGSYKFDNHMADLGLRKGLTLNPEAIKRINAFAELTPESLRDPSKFLFRYADLGNKASRVQLFNEDPRKAYEWFSDAAADFRRGLAKDLRSFDRSIDKFRGDVSTWVKKHLTNVLGRRRALKLKDFLVNGKLLDFHNKVGTLRNYLAPLGARVKAKRTARKKFHEAMVLAHEAEIGKSKPRALIRLMNEWEDVGHTSAKSLVNDTAKALREWRTSINPYTGKPYKNVVEYMSTRYTHGEKAMSNYMKFFKDLDVEKPLGRKELVREIKKRLFPSTFIADSDLDTIKMKGKNPFQKEVLKNLGRTTKYQYDPAANRLYQAERFSRRPGIKGISSVESIIKKSPTLTFIANDLGVGYRGKEFGQMIKVLRGAQLLRNPKLRLALGLGSAGLGGLGVSNLIKRFSSKKPDR